MDAAVLGHMIASARTRGMARLSLETGSWDYFAPFAGYVLDPSSVFMTLDLRIS